MASVNLSAAPRTGAGKGVARKLRAAGQVPGILYGYGTDPQPLSVDSVVLRKALSTAAGVRVIMQLQVEGAERSFAVLVKDLQRHPLTRNITHIDLVSIDLDVPVEVSVPINPIGTPLGVREQGGTLEWQRRELLMSVLPTRIPEQIDLDISGLELNGAFHVGDVSVEGAELLEEPQLTICSVKMTRMTVPEPDEEGEAVEGEGEEVAEGEEAEGDADAEASDGDTES